jgi:hypothetical protein
MGSFGLAENFNPLAPLPPYVVTAKTTALARRLIARGSVDGTAVKVIGFEMGSGGYDVLDYTQAAPVNPEASMLESAVWFSPTIVLEWANESCSSYYCMLDLTDAVSPLGEIGIVSEVVWSPIASEIGMWFLSALGHFPLKVKSDTMQFAIRVLRQS